MKGGDANAKRLFGIFALIKSRRLSLAVALDSILAATLRLKIALVDCHSAFTSKL